VKIVLLCRSFDVGGTERQIVILAKGLHQQGHEVSVIVFYSHGALEKELHDNGIAVFDLRKSGRWDIFLFFVRAVRAVWRLKPQVIYGFLGTPNILAVFLKPFFLRARIVWGVRASNVDLDRYDWLSRLSYRIECWLSRFADLIICNSLAGLEYAAAHGFPRRLMTVIPNGIDTEYFKPDAVARKRIRAEWGVAENEILIGLVARLDPMKDHLTFLRAAAMLIQERKDVRFVCVGEGSEPYTRELHRQSSGLGLDGVLIWAGARYDVPAVCNALDIASSSSYSEGFSNTIAEAMACSVPCVVTDVGDSAFIVSDTGCVVPPVRPDALCDGFRLMLKAFGSSLGNTARDSIVSRFTNELMVSNTLKAVRSMKVVLLVRSLHIGGTERQLLVHAKGLHQQGHEVSVIVFYSHGALEKELHDNGIAVFDLRKSGRWDIFLFFVRAVRAVWRLKPQVIYGFLGTPNILAVFLKPFFLRARIVWGVRASNVDLDRYDWLSRLSYRIECWLSRFADLIICNSLAGLEYAAAHGFPRRLMTVIPNGIDTEYFKPDAVARKRIRAEWGVAENEILIGLVARLDPMKDHLTFLRAAAMLIQERKDVRFVCVGEGSEPYTRELHRQSSGLGLDGVLIWAGARYDVPAVCNALDIASSSSYSEGFSNTIAEAMACSVPCVVTDVGDSAFIVSDTGCVVPPVRPDALCDGFRLMLKAFGSSLGNTARDSIVSRFTNERLIGKTMEAFWSTS
jgi:glycosyltransferase involved in cell wall biosynthesis